MSTDDKIGPRDLLTILDAQDLLKREDMGPVRAVFAAFERDLLRLAQALKQIADGADEPDKLARDALGDAYEWLEENR